MRHTLRDFIAELDAAGELTRIAEAVSPVLEIAARADAEAKKLAPNLPSAGARRCDPEFHHLGGKALLFENVEGSDLPLLINAFGSYRRTEMALGCEGVGFEAIADRIGSLMKPEPPASLREILGKVKQLAPLLRIPPRKVRRGACQEIVLTGDDIDLTRLPMIKCWPMDGDLDAVGYPANVNASVPGADLIDDPNYQGRYITFAHIHTIHADDAGKAKPPSHNMGMYRVQLIGRRRMAMHWHMHHDGARHWRSWKEKGEPMPVAIVFGGESVLPFSSIAPLPPGVSELLMAGFLNGKGIPMCAAKTVPLRVPANAEIVIEGYVSTECSMPDYDPRAPCDGPIGAGAFFEGPFGDHTGFYSLPDRYPTVEVTAITRRRDAVFPATIVGMPPQEDYYLGKAVERLFLPLLRTLAPDIIDYDLPMFGCFHNCVVLQIKKEYPLQGRRLMHSVWGAGQMAWTKCVVVVDEDVDVHDRAAVFKAIAQRCDPNQDVELVRGPMDMLDHASPMLGAGTKIGFDATRKIEGERQDKKTEAAAAPDARTISLDEVRAMTGVLDAAILDGDNSGWLLVQADAEDAGVVRQIAGLIDGRDGGINQPRFIVLLGVDVDIHNADEALFHFVANMDPGRDRVDLPGAMLFDARPKKAGVGLSGAPVRDWPPMIECLPIGAARS